MPEPYSPEQPTALQEVSIDPRINHLIDFVHRAEDKNLDNPQEYADLQSKAELTAGLILGSANKDMLRWAGFESRLTGLQAVNIILDGPSGGKYLDDINISVLTEAYHHEDRGRSADRLHQSLDRAREIPRLEWQSDPIRQTTLVYEGFKPDQNESDYPHYATEAVNVAISMVNARLNELKQNYHKTSAITSAIREMRDFQANEGPFALVAKAIPEAGYLVGLRHKLQVHQILQAEISHQLMERKQIEEDALMAQKLANQPTVPQHEGLPELVIEQNYNLRPEDYDQPEGELQTAEANTIGNYLGVDANEQSGHNFIVYDQDTLRPYSAGGQESLFEIPSDTKIGTYINNSIRNLQGNEIYNEFSVVTGVMEVEDPQTHERVNAPVVYRLNAEEARDPQDHPDAYRNDMIHINSKIPVDTRQNQNLDNFS